ncbi:MAG: PspC domain-containing protein [Bacteroidales bacterium]|nr:PspC domain-containing protein [Bacteroidales bacterium]
MKKTLTVNISGIVFHIDEDAYTVLNDYLQSIRMHFSRAKGGEEIISDIEARIAEMLKEKIGDERQVITIDDIEDVINVIGQPSEFGEEFAEGAEEKSTYSQKTTKRLYRDTDRSVLGGVCGGLGAYFHTDPLWFRLAFVLLSIPGIGTPLLVYVVLWIVLPEAKTAAERLEMKGEKINITNIESSIREEIDNLKDKFKNFKNEARRTYKKKSADHRSDMEGVGNALGKVAELFVKMVLVFTGIILFIIGLSFIIALIAVLFGFGQDIFIVNSEFIYVSFTALVDFFLGSVGSSLLFMPAFIMLIGIPVLMVFYAGIKLIFGLERTRFVGITALNLWLVAMLVSGYYGVKVFRSFSHTGVYQETVGVEAPQNDLLRLQVADDDKFNRYYRYEEYVNIDEANMIITNDEDDFFYGIPQLEIVESHSGNIELDLYYRARGKSNQHAENRARETKYSYSISDGTITFDRFFKLNEKEIWRDQQIDIVIKLPIGCKVYMAENMRMIINDFHHSPYRLSGETWVMTDSGLEESDYIPVLPDKPEEEEMENQIIPEQSGVNTIQNRQASVIGFIYTRLLSVFGYLT